MLSFFDIIVYISIGIFTGISVGLVGIGAGVLFIPLLVGYGMNIKQAIAVGLALQLVPQSLPGFYLYYKQGFADLPVIFITIFGSTIGIFFGAYLSTKKIVSELFIYQILFFILCATVLFIGYKIIKLKVKGAAL